MRQHFVNESPFACAFSHINFSNKMCTNNQLAAGWCGLASKNYLNAAHFPPLRKKSVGSQPNGLFNSLIVWS